jgi:hypothetical protein
MADEFTLLKEGLLEMAERAAEVVIAQRGPAFAPQTGPMGDPFGAPDSTQLSADMATGYDGAETVMPFRLDLSLLDGDDVLVD